MRFFHPLDKILDSEPKVRILRFFAETNTEISGLQLAKLLKLSPTTVHKAMHELMAEKVVRMRAMGRAHSFCINDQNWVVTKVLRSMFSAERAMPADLNEVVSLFIQRSSLKKDILSVALFGSVHEKSEGPGSDIDLFVVVKASASVAPVEELLSEAGGELLAQVGMVLSPFVISLDEFKEKNKAGQPIVRSAVKSHTMIFGKPLERLL